MAYQTYMQELLDELGASRTTLRLDTPGETYPVVAEALAPGIASIKGDTRVGDLRAAKTFQYIERELKPLVQNDLLDADPAPPKELIELYGARSQMLAPIVRNGRLAGVISVHYAPGPREWTAEELATLERCAAQVTAELEAS